MLGTSEIKAVISERRSIFPKMYNGNPISDELIWEILESANWAPNHKKTEPWRFKVLKNKALERLSKYCADHYELNTPAEKFSAMKMKKKAENPLKSACVIAICMQRDPAESLPEWEEIAAVSCAVQNMWLHCTAAGIGSYWSSPKAALEADEFLGLKQGESCLGFFYMGYFDVKNTEGKRGSIQEKVEWFEE